MRAFYLLTIILFIFSEVFATHNRAGEITYRQLSELTYEVTIVTYTKTSSPADRPSLDIKWGDNTSATLNRSEEVLLANDIKRNKYVGTHTYPGPSTYIISFEDPNRNADIVNIDNSVNVPFYVESILQINPFLGFNNSPILLQPPIDNGTVNKLFIHNPNAYDIDGDSLSYKLVSCKGASGLDVINYFYPYSPTYVSNSFSLDVLTGDLIWDTPQQVGEYNVAILIEEWRSGIKIGSIIRDMQIDIEPSNNNPPVINTIIDTCLEAGDTLVYNVFASDPDNDQVTLTATGGPFLVGTSPAQFTQPVSGIGSVSSIFTWITACAHVRKEPYQVVLKAEDNDAQVQLVDLEAVNITIVGPSPKNPIATPSGNSVLLSWDMSECAEAIGYNIYRRNGFYGFIPAYCETGVPSYTGYALLDTVIGLNNISYVDNNNGAGLIHGVDYCYMIVASYPDGAESYASEEVCVQLKKDLPVITNVSIRNTDQDTGSVYIAWSKPTELDTVQIPGPYKYLIYRSYDFPGTSFTLIDSTGMVSGLNDTIFIDTLAGVNTVNTPVSYRIAFYNDTPGNRFLVGNTQKASSVFLSISPTDNRLDLSWDENVPWTNTSYVIYKYNIYTFLYDSIGTTTAQTFSDTGLTNGNTYCYYIKSIGGYSGSGFINPIINLSQKLCAVPFDNIPPCAPQLSVTPDCISYQNFLVWNNPNNSCSDDVLQYNIYYSPILNGQLELIASINSASDTFYLHNLATAESIAGCYLITALDSVGNESEGGIISCVDNCPLYEIPNVFTPDGDGFNNLLIPFPYRYVKNINIKIYNRWGQLMFQTNDPDIMWNGKNQKTKKDCPEGVYYYTCEVSEMRLQGIKKRILTGFVHLLSNKN